MKNILNKVQHLVGKVVRSYDRVYYIQGCSTERSTKRRRIQQSF